MVRRPACVLPSPSRDPVLFARRANGNRNQIRLCAEMETGTSIPSEHRGSGPVFRSGVCHRADRLPQRGCSIQTSSKCTTMASRAYCLLLSHTRLTSKEAGGGPHSPRPGSYPAMEAGQRVPSAGIPRPPPSRNGADGQSPNAKIRLDGAHAPGSRAGWWIGERHTRRRRARDGRRCVPLRRHYALDLWSSVPEQTPEHRRAERGAW